ncbi:MAG: DUF2786 domain-containing protein [Bacteriovoracaceae bacterium]|nr:DUF2786 domain-containing protein [Bacteriovoracaceae bacterium]
MLIYSKTSQSFIARTQKYLVQIMESEMGLNFRTKRFDYGDMHYPIQLVVFEKPGELGRFDPLTYQLGLSKTLMYSTDTEGIKDIIRHELAHLIAHIDFGNGILPHGAEFKSICQRYNWGPETKRASVNLSEQELSKSHTDIRSERVIAKVQKLLKLASSDNVHEAELATIKANQLLLKHNLDLLGSNADDDEEYCVKRVICGKRVLGKHHAIYEILTTFFVHPVFNHGQGGFYLEVMGSRANVELAEYVANFLDHQLDKLWTEARKDLRGKSGIRQKNSYMRGASRGYKNKIEASKAQVCSSKDLVKVNMGLARGLKIVYGRLGSTSSQSRDCLSSRERGQKDGENLSINPAVKNTGLRKLLSF